MIVKSLHKKVKLWFKSYNYLFQGLLPAVTFLAEWTRKLLGMDTRIGRIAILTAIQIFGAHLFLQMLL